MCWVNMSGCHMSHPCMLMFEHVLYMGASVLMPTWGPYKETKRLGLLCEVELGRPLHNTL